MPLAFSQNAVIAQPGQSYAMSALLAATPGYAPEYIVLVGLDRERYPASLAGAAASTPGTLSGTGEAIAFHAYPGSDCASFGVVFSHTASGYYSGSHGYLADLNYHASAAEYRSAYLALYGYGSAAAPDSALGAKLQAEVGQPFFDGGAFMEARNYPVSGELGALNIVTRSGYADPTPNAATPDEIAAVAASYVGKTWDDNGCWVLASNIAASAGASLPLTSDEARPTVVPPLANGGWIVAYNSAAASAAQKLSWQQLLRPGDILVADNSCGGHVSTVVAGSGYAAQFIDNSGGAAAGGGPHDIVIGAAHTMPYWALGDDPDNVVVYRLDTPLISVASGLAGSGKLAPLFSVQDPAGKTVQGYQFYATAAGSFTLDGAASGAHSAAEAITVDSASLARLAFSAAAPGTVEVRAFNGSYWGDWETIAVAPAPATAGTPGTPGTATGAAAQPALLRPAADTVFVHGGQSLALSSLVVADARSSAITSYTVTYPAHSGTVQLNGAANLYAGAAPGADQERTLEVNAADFARLTYTASAYSNADTLGITAHNASPLASVEAHVVMAAQVATVHAAPQWVTPDSEIPLSALFNVTLPDGTAVTSYSISTTGVQVIDWGPNSPSSGGTLQLHGAVDLIAGIGAPPGNYQIAAQDLDKVTFRAAPDLGAQFIEIWANNGAGGAPGSAMLTTVAGAAPVAAHAAAIKGGETIALSSLFSANGEAQAYYRITDPDGAGSLHLRVDGTNLQAKSALSPGVFIVAAADLDKLSYEGARAGGSEQLALSTSADMLHWSGAVMLPVASSAVLPLQALDVEGWAAQVYRLYKAAFDRAPDAAGFRWWLGNVEHGTSMLEVARDFSVSGEFAARFGSEMSDSAYAALLYQNVLHRAPDAGGLQFWSGALAQGVPRADVMLQFAASAENHVQLAGVISGDLQYLLNA
ncbi:DUF4214 domain-containing protein [Pseudoduganella sp. LjRoot289]|uniref:DUF4214 domain-containing protein n=1 Tax=Pseudoduganella sp. LjRoot289 TaxID=3342314 RepID=UPI003ECF3524